MNKKLLYGGYLTLKMTLIFAIAASASQAIAMEKPSWAQALWHSAKDSFFSLSLIKNELQLRKLRQDIEEIVKNGKSVQEVEMKKIREKHHRTLENFKECACIQDKKWNKFLKNFENLKNADPVFNSDSSQLQDDEEHSDAIMHTIRSKLKRDNLNFKNVNIELTTDDKFSITTKYKYDHVAKKYYDPNHIFQLNINQLHNCPLSCAEFKLEHEIKHLKQNHAAEKILLRKITPKNKEYCFDTYDQETEFEADALAAFQDIRIAKGGREYYCSHLKNNWSYAFTYFLTGYSHPSDYNRCIQLSRIAFMLEIEKDLKEKKKSSNPASNS